MLYNYNSHMPLLKLQTEQLFYNTVQHMQVEHTYIHSDPTIKYLLITPTETCSQVHKEVMRMFIAKPTNSGIDKLR